MRTKTRNRTLYLFKLWEDLKLDDNTDTLPPCAKCKKCEFKKG